MPFLFLTLNLLVCDLSYKLTYKNSQKKNRAPKYVMLEIKDNLLDLISRVKKEKKKSKL
jgi:hypothetical protein